MNLAPAPLVTKELLLSIVITSPTVNLLPALIFSISLTAPVVPSIVILAVAPEPSPLIDFNGIVLATGSASEDWLVKLYPEPPLTISGCVEVLIDAATFSTATHHKTG